eukprot:347955-Chlamydomonas_euryale.AAC.2
MKDYVAEHRIDHRLSCAYTPQQNGKAKRFNHTLMDRVIAMLLGSRAEQKLWGEAVFAAAYVLNLSPSVRRRGATPHGGLFGVCSNVAHLRVWGCPVHVMSPKHKRRKLDAKAVPCPFVGYQDTAGLRVLCDDGNIRINGGVIFHETRRHEPVAHGVPQTSGPMDFLIEFGAGGGDAAPVAAPGGGAPGGTPGAAPQPGAPGAGCDNNNDNVNSGTDNSDVGGDAGHAAAVAVSAYDAPGGGGGDGGGDGGARGHHSGGGKGHHSGGGKDTSLTFSPTSMMRTVMPIPLRPPQHRHRSCGAALACARPLEIGGTHVHCWRARLGSIRLAWWSQPRAPRL